MQIENRSQEGIVRVSPSIVYPASLVYPFAVRAAYQNRLVLAPIVFT